MAILNRPGGVEIHWAVPEAHLETVDDGFISGGDQVAAVVRRITSAAPSPLA
jgi:hypothetical protein